MHHHERRTRTIERSDLRATADEITVTELATGGMPIAMFEESEFSCAASAVPLHSQLLLYSDGAYELSTPDGEYWPRENFVSLCARLAATPDWSPWTMGGLYLALIVLYELSMLLARVTLRKRIAAQKLDAPSVR